MSLPSALHFPERSVTKEYDMAVKRKDVVQVKNPVSGRYVKVDRTAGQIVAHKKTSGPYKGVPVARKRAK